MGLGLKVIRYKTNKEFYDENENKYTAIYHCKQCVEHVSLNKLYSVEHDFFLLSIVERVSIVIHTEEDFNTSNCGT